MAPNGHSFHYYFTHLYTYQFCNFVMYTFSVSIEVAPLSNNILTTLITMYVTHTFQVSPQFTSKTSTQKHKFPIWTYHIRLLTKILQPTDFCTFARPPHDNAMVSVLISALQCADLKFSSPA